jgi:hypothetical protein
VGRTFADAAAACAAAGFRPHVLFYEVAAEPEPAAAALPVLPPSPAPAPSAAPVPAVPAAVPPTARRAEELEASVPRRV